MRGADLSERCRGSARPYVGMALGAYLTVLGAMAVTTPLMREEPMDAAA